MMNLFADTDAGVCEYRIPALATTAEGVLIAVCDARVDERGDAPNNIHLAMRRSFDGGDSWTPIAFIVQFPGREAACDPSLLIDERSGAVWLFYDYAVPDATLPRGRRMMLHAIRSDDDGATWSPPRDLTDLAPQGCHLMNAPGRGIAARSGTLMQPVYTRDANDASVCRLLCSEDGGATWQLRTAVDGQGVEPQVAERSDGGIVMNIRQYPKATAKSLSCRKVAVSHDEGWTWSAPRNDRTLVDPGCQASLHRHAPSGTILFCNANDPAERRNLTMRISEDDGASWSRGRTVEPGKARYSCMTTLPDRRIGLLYETPGKVTLARFDLDMFRQ